MNLPIVPEVDPGALLGRLREIVGRRHVLSRASQMRGFTHGYRYGVGPALAVVRPADPLEQYRCFCAIVEAGAIVIVQAANTGLTGGSTPDGVYDRPVVIISTRRITGIHLIKGGTQAVCLAGATLYGLERVLAPTGREPHSVIGSSCIGASVVGGVCNNSGGALVRRGPAYTEYALYARAEADGRVTLVDHLGLDLGASPEEVLRKVAAGTFTDADVQQDKRAASSVGYDQRLRQVDADSPARYNADAERLYEASGSAGKVMVIAVRLDTFEKDARTCTYYIGSNNIEELTAIRRAVLGEFRSLPISGEYIHREAFDVAATYGKDIFLAIERFGTDRLPLLFALRNRVDAVAAKLKVLPRHLSDRLMQAGAGLFGQHLPARMREWRDRYEHHLILKVSDEGCDEARSLLGTMFPSVDGDFFECDETEARKAFLHRFAVAGAALRYRAIHGREVGEIIALDIALRRNDRDWFEALPDELDRLFVKKLYYGHFFCHVFHQDYITIPGVDPVAVEHRMWELLDRRGAEYPAEHNVGRLYPAKPSLERHYRELDPGNCLNPGIGQTSRHAHWR